MSYLPNLLINKVIEHSNYVQKLIRENMRKTSTAHLLNGYIEFHNKTCLNLACPLKKVKFSSGSHNNSNITKGSKLTGKAKEIMDNIALNKNMATGG